MSKVTHLIRPFLKWLVLHQYPRHYHCRYVSFLSHVSPNKLRLIFTIVIIFGLYQSQELPPTPSGGTMPSSPPAIHTFFTGDEVVMRVSIKATPPPDFIEGTPYISQVVWHASDTLPPSTCTTTLTKETSQPHAIGSKASQASDGRIIYSGPSSSSVAAAAAASNAAAGMLLHEVLSLTFHFLCPEKESVHPISLGHVRIYWKTILSTPSHSSAMAALGKGGSGSGNSRGRPAHIANDWTACTEVLCPAVTVVKPDLAVDLHAPAEAKVRSTSERTNFHHVYKSACHI